MFTRAKIFGGGTYLKNHLAENDYYAEGEKVTGRWIGRGAELLGPVRGATGKSSSRNRRTAHPAHDDDTPTNPARREAGVSDPAWPGRFRSGSGEFSADDEAASQPHCLLRFPVLGSEIGFADCGAGRRRTVAGSPRASQRDGFWGTGAVRRPATKYA